MTNDDEGCRFGFGINNTCSLRSTLNMVDLVRRALAQVALGVQACLEEGPDTGGGGLACFAGGALAGTPVGGAGGLGSSESEKLEERNKSFCIECLQHF